MDAWMAFVSIIAIIAIVLVAGGIIAFLGHMIIGVFDKDRQAESSTKKETLDYSQYKQLENSDSKNNEYDFSTINLAKAEKEKEAAIDDKNDDELFKLLDDGSSSDDDIKEIEDRLKKNDEASEPVVEEKTEDNDEDLDNLLDEISNDVIDEEKDKINEENNKPNETLAKYNIDDILNQMNNQEQEAEDTTDNDNQENSEELEEEPEEVEEESSEEAEKVEEENKEETEEENSNSEELEKANKEIEDLKAQLLEMNKKLEEARTEKPEVSIDMTEDQCIARLATLEDRLKEAKKDYKINMKEYRPLKKVMKEYEKYTRKLRKKDMQLSNKMISLYGVNNYVDLDKEKAENVLNESNLVEGLRLSVSHCEEVINANKDRYPILEHTNNILENQIANLEADIESTKQILEKIREKKGSGNSDSEQNN